MPKLRCDMTLKEYWDLIGVEMAEMRAWDGANQSNVKVGCANYQKYTYWIRRLSPYLKKKSISELTFFDLQNAVEAIKKCKLNGGKYSESTISGVRSALHVIFRYAQAHGDACDLFRYAHVKKDTKEIALIKEIFDPLVSETVRMSRIRAAMEGRIYKARSLTPEQQAKLIRILQDCILEDGRYCGLAIILYAGVRPAECRALLWRDVVSFVDHPERHMLYLHDTRNAKGKLTGRMKTENAYRKVPVHIELEELLRIRLEYVKKLCPDSDEYLDYPICCFQNEVERPCRDYQFAAVADDVLNRLSLTGEELAAYLLDMAYEDRKSSHKDKDSTTHLSLYVLRRNYWTWMQASTQLTEYEKLYVMGHKMELNGENIRPTYNNQTCLWEICSKMDRYIISRRLHEKLLRVELQENETISYENRGVVQIEIPKELLCKKGVLRIRATSVESGDQILLRAISAVKRLGKLEVKGIVTECPASGEKITGINCELDTYNMLKDLSKNMKAASSAKKKEPN